MSIQMPSGVMYGHKSMHTYARVYLSVVIATGMITVIMTTTVNLIVRRTTVVITTTITSNYNWLQDCNYCQFVRPLSRSLQVVTASYVDFEPSDNVDHENPA